MEILGKLGIDLKLLLAQLINFAILLWLLKRFVYRPIINKIEKDEKELTQAKTKLNELKSQKDSFSKQKSSELADTKKKAKEIIAEAEGIAKGIKEKAQKETREEKEEVIKQIKSKLSDLENEK